MGLERNHKNQLTFILLMWRIGRAPINASKWHVGFNSAFKGLMIFERKVLRRIFGPTKERYGTWGIKTND
jgi:hypothetical protein